jgi:ribosomal protein L35AE/L33A
VVPTGRRNTGLKFLYRCLVLQGLARLVTISYYLRNRFATSKFELDRKMSQAKQLRWIYRSTPLQPPQEVLLDIVRVSERRNAEFLCSGVLLYGNQTYAQMIEGPVEGVTRLSELIARDPRHVMGDSFLADITHPLVSGALPMGYVEMCELTRAGLQAPVAKPLRDESVLASFIAAVALKYPSAYVSGR